ncbi:hypothetical protein PIB30_038521 [Stylosanthes scabra]|uniref:U-box domain-containing protein n=1 Tax=Stylosanthes scabra TaxID=79078 RepID=A0ABU6UDC1_9FABA|nr:hypothetical protein [Stylosanthes scabra]
MCPRESKWNPFQPHKHSPLLSSESDQRTGMDEAKRDLTPNHTLQRLIQNWCTHNHVSLDETTQHDSTSTIEKAQVVKLLSEAKGFSHDEKLKFLKWIKTIALESESNKKCLQSVGEIDCRFNFVDH